MDEINRKRNLILKHEEKFANEIAVHVIEKPKLTLWIILIPIFVVFYIMQMQKCVKGRKDFAGHYLLNKKRALNEAVEIVRAGRDPDIEKLAELSDAPAVQGKSIQKCFQSLLNIL